MQRLQILFLFLPFFAFAQADHRTEHVFIVTTDGLRWHEVFQGGDPAAGGHTVTGTTDAPVSRETLMPFLWNRVARDGQLLGNRAFGNEVGVTNRFRISYPGYNELLTGYADPVFIPNLPIRNRNRNMLGLFNNTRRFRGKVAAFATWKLFPFILNEHRDRLPLNPDSREGGAAEGADRRTFQRALNYIEKKKPDLVFLSFGETDECAHRKNYPAYLKAATTVDELIGRLWAYLQSEPYYKDHTSLIVTTDHGRGEGGRWYRHGPFSKGSAETWLALLGPDVAPLGEIRCPGKATAAQVAASIPWLLGEPVKTSRRPAPAPLTALTAPAPAAAALLSISRK